jgi:DNA-directed RNA polymerase specialized sigma24 family protein
VHKSDHTFDDWVGQYQRLLFGIAYWWTGSRTDAEELTQEAFFQAYRSRSSLREIEAVKGWLVGILRHCYAQRCRKDHSRIEIPLDEVVEKSGETIDLRSDGADPHDILALRQALERLDEGIECPWFSFIFRSSHIERLPRLWNCRSAPSCPDFPAPASCCTKASLGRSR